MWGLGLGSVYDCVWNLVDVVKSGMPGEGGSGRGAKKRHFGSGTGRGGVGGLARTPAGLGVFYVKRYIYIYICVYMCVKKW